MIPDKITFEEDYKGKPTLLVRIKDELHIGHHISPELSDLLKYALNKWNDSVYTYYHKYDEERGKLFFVYDVIKLLEHLKELEGHIDIYPLIDIGDYTEIMHNRWLTYFMSYFKSKSYNVDVDMNNRLLPKKHDFNLNGIRCEIKTVQTLATLDLSRGGVIFEPNSLNHLFLKLHEIIFEAIKQVGTDGIIFITFWCLGTNSLLYHYFSPVLPQDIEDIKGGSIIFCIEYPVDNPGEEKSMSDKRFIVFPISSYDKKLDELYDYLFKTKIKPEPLQLTMMPPEINIFIGGSTEWMDFGTRLRLKFPDRPPEQNIEEWSTIRDEWYASDGSLINKGKRKG